MKADIHPQIHPVVFLDTSTGAEFLTTSTLTSEEKKKINGVDHYVIKVEISSASHPFYTGKRKLVDTAGRVDKFLERAKKAQEIKEKQVKKIDEELDEVLHEKEGKKEEKKKEEKKPVKKSILKVETAKEEKAPEEKEDDKAEAPEKSEESTSEEEKKEE